jgi:hypothetical protein
MSSNLYKAAASVEAVGVLVYSGVCVITSTAAILKWGGPWFPLFVILAIISLRLAASHLKERNALLKDAAEIDKHESDDHE